MPTSNDVLFHARLYIDGGIGNATILGCSISDDELDIACKILAINENLLSFPKHQVADYEAVAKKIATCKLVVKTPRRDISVNLIECISLNQRTGHLDVIFNNRYLELSRFILDQRGMEK